jgi:hypothetical protein
MLYGVKLAVVKAPASWHCPLAFQPTIYGHCPDATGSLKELGDPFRFAIGAMSTDVYDPNAYVFPVASMLTCVSKDVCLPVTATPLIVTDAMDA